MRKGLLYPVFCGFLVAAPLLAQETVPATESERELREELARMKEQVARVEALLAKMDAARSNGPPQANLAETVRAQAPALNTPSVLPPSRAENFRKAPPRFDVLLQVRGDFPEDTARSNSFLMRKVELGLKGHIVENVDFSLEVDLVRPNDLLRRTYIRLTHFDKLHVKLGLEKSPIGLDELTSASRIPFVDRSEVSDRFSAAEQLGVHLESRWEKWLFQFAVTNGGRRLLRDDNRHKDTVGRIVYSPHRFVSVGLAALKGESGAAGAARDRYNAEFRWGTLMTGLQSEFFRARDADVLSSAFYVAGYWAIPTHRQLLTHIQPVARYEFIGRSDRDRLQERRLFTLGASFLFTEQGSKFQINYVKDLLGPARLDELRAQYQIAF